MPMAYILVIKGMLKGVTMSAAMLSETSNVFPIDINLYFVPWIAFAPWIQNVALLRTESDRFLS